MQKHPTAAVVLILIVLTSAVYWRVLGDGFVTYDDNTYVYDNRHIQQGITLESLRWAFNTGYACNWHPLTWISHMIDCRLFGMKPMGHHLVSLLLHILNTVLLLLVLRRMTGSLWKSAFVAALFAVHPLHVESVAWVAERKDVLSTFLWLLTMGAYALYVEKPGIKRYLAVVLLFALGLMAKPMLVTLPLALFLLDYWPLKRKGRWSTLVLDKTPLLALSVASCVITFVAQTRGGAVGRLDTYTPAVRIANALVGYVTYLGKMLWPTDLAVLYPHPGETLAVWKAPASAILLVAISILVVLLGKKRPYLRVGWLWFLGTLVPVIGLVQVGSQAIADRYTYVPFIGLFIMVAWGIPDLVGERRKGRKKERERWERKASVTLMASACLIIGILAVATHAQLSYWRTSRTLFEHALNCTTRNYTMEDCLGLLLLREDKPDEAAKHHRTALAINPKFPSAHNNLGIILAGQGNVEEAVKHFRRAVELEPDRPISHFNLAVALYDQGKVDEAISEYRKCISRNPDYPLAYYNLGDALERLGKPDEAAAQYRRALKVDPAFTPAADALIRLGEQ